MRTPKWSALKTRSGDDQRASAAQHENEDEQLGADSCRFSGKFLIA